MLPPPPRPSPYFPPNSVRNSLVRFQRCAITKPWSYMLHHVIRFEENLPTQRAGSPGSVTQQSRKGHLSNEMEPFTGFGMMSSLPCLCTCLKLRNSFFSGPCNPSTAMNQSCFINRDRKEASSHNVRQPVQSSRSSAIESLIIFSDDYDVHTPQKLRLTRSRTLSFS